jgi:putative membrane protein
MEPAVVESTSDHRWLAMLSVMVCVVLIWSWIGAADRMTWWLEAFPAFIGALMLAATYRRFRFTWMAYLLIALRIPCGMTERKATAASFLYHSG